MGSPESPSSSEEGLGWWTPVRITTPLRLTSKLASLAAPPLKRRGSVERQRRGRRSAHLGMPIGRRHRGEMRPRRRGIERHQFAHRVPARSEEHTSELQSLMRISYAVFCLKKKTNKERTRQKT